MSRVPLPAERLSGTDAMLVNLARLGHPLHTLKLLLVDPTRIGRPLTLDDVREFLAQHLADYPRLGQRVVGVPPFAGRPFWVPAADLTLDAHLDERTAPSPGDRSVLDGICSELATLPLDPYRPLWRLTLVSGLAGDQQAVIVQVHHAVGDGLSAMNTLRDLTTANPAFAVLPRLRTGAPSSSSDRQHGSCDRWLYQTPSNDCWTCRGS